MMAMFESTASGGKQYEREPAAKDHPMTKPESKPEPVKAFQRGDRVRKKSCTSWQGIVCGEYSTSLTPEGCAVESERERGSVQIYPAAALEFVPITPEESE